MFRSTLDQLTSAAKSSKARQVLEVPVDAVDADPDQPRKTFEDLEDLTASIAAIGIKQPLLVRAHPSDRGRYLLIAGERRLRSARLAGLPSVPCLVETGDAETPGQLVITQLTENLQRKEVPILETAQALARALEATGLSKGDLARALGKKASFVSKHLALLSAEGPAQEALEEGLLLSTETFRLFSGLTIAGQRNLLTQARLNQEPIARGQVERDPKSSDKPEPETPQGSPTKPRAESAAEGSFHLKLDAEQVRAIIRRFGLEAPKELSDLKPTLLELLR